MELLLARTFGEGGGPVVEITAATAGLPAGSVLARAVIPPASLATFPAVAWVTVPFAMPATVVADQQYAIILRPPADAPAFWQTLWSVDAAGTYPGGLAARSTANSPWGLDWGPQIDAGFRTYVDSTPTVPIVTVTLPPPDGTNGWHRTSPVVATVTATTVSPSTLATLTCTAGTLGAVSGLGTATATAPLSLTSQGTSTGACTATSPNGGPGSSAPFTIMLDSVAPTYTTSLTTADGQPYTPGTQATQPVTVTFTCSDATSGVGGVVASQTFTGVGLDQTAMATCGDAAGNITILSVGNIDIPKLAGGPGPMPAPNPSPSPSPSPSTSPTPTPSPVPTPFPKPAPAPPTQTPIPTAVPTMPPKPGLPTRTPCPFRCVE